MGKKYTTILTLFVIICFLLSGCDRDEGQNTGYGTMSLQVSANANVIELKPHANTRSNNSTDSVVHTRVEEESDFVPEILKSLYIKKHRPRPIQKQRLQKPVYSNMNGIV